MARRDGFSRGLESLEEIRASDRFIEQLRVSGTYEPSTRTDAALAGALLTWRDDARLEPLNPPPTADDVDLDSYAQPRRIARRAVAVAGALLALSSAAATAIDGDPLRPVRFLVDLGVSVGERIGHPSSEPSSEGSPSESITSGEDGSSPDAGNPDYPWSNESTNDGRHPVVAPLPGESDSPPEAGTQPTDTPPSITSTDETTTPPDQGETTTPPDDQGGTTSPPGDQGGTTTPPDDQGGTTTPPGDQGETTTPPDEDPQGGINSTGDLGEGNSPGPGPGDSANSNTSSPPPANPENQNGNGGGDQNGQGGDQNGNSQTSSSESEWDQDSFFGGPWPSFFLGPYQFDHPGHSGKSHGHGHAYGHYFQQLNKHERAELRNYLHLNRHQFAALKKYLKGHERAWHRMHLNKHERAELEKWLREFRYSGAAWDRWGNGSVRWRDS